jgi:DNA-binding transcriptional LysR family regulator
MNESLKDFSLFTTIVKHRGFASASEPLGLTPSAVSKAVARLEKRIGARLFTRSTRTIKLTEAGEELYSRAQHILAAVEEAESVISNLSTEPQGDIRVACSDAFATMVLVPLLEGFNQRYPNIRVHVTQGDGPMDLIKEDYDIAIRFENPYQKGLYITPLTSDPWVICASPKYLAKQPAPQKPPELLEHQCLAIRARDRLDSTWKFRGGRRHSINVTPSFSGIGMVVKTAAIRGLGIARLANFLVKQEIENGTLVALLEDYQIKENRKIYAVTPDRGYQPAKTQALLSALKQQFS